MAGQLGLERTPEEYVAKMVEGFREVRRVLRDDGTCWVNLGDCYATGAGKVGDCPGGGEQGDKWKGYRGTRQDGKHAYIAQAVGPMIQPNRMPIAGLKPKDLVMMPARVALALQADGWYLRQDIIWAKPNPMPESVTDRCTKSHEYIFLLTKSARYWYDAEAVKEPAAWERWGDQTVVKEQQGTAKWIGNKTVAELTGRGGKNAFRGQGSNRDADNGHANRDGRDMTDVGANLTRNKRSVWNVATSPFPEAHFATFPPEIPEICIKAGCPEGGTVLDPFCGAGTTGMVAKRLMRSFIGIELNPQYVEMARRRIVNDAPLFNEVSTFAQESHAEID